MSNDKIKIRKANLSELNAVVDLYNDICDSLEEGINYADWHKDIYPTIDDARLGIEDGVLYIALIDDQLVGSVKLRHEHDDAYLSAPWLTENDYSKITVIYTLAVHPNAKGQGVARALLDFAETTARAENNVSIRLDTVYGNTPAEKLYLSCGYKLIGTVHSEIGPDKFDLFEKLL